MLLLLYVPFVGHRSWAKLRFLAVTTPLDVATSVVTPDSFSTTVFNGLVGGMVVGASLRN